MTDLQQPEHCETLDEIRAHDGQRVILTGIYNQVDLRMRRKPPAVYAGQVAIRLRDETDVLLESSLSPAVIRSAEERARYDGKRVEVTGVVHSQAPEPSQPVAYIMGPCVSPVEGIRPAAKESSR